MYLESRKISLIQEVLNIDDDAVLNELENVLKGNRVNSTPTLSIYDFAGKLTKEEAEEMERAIAETTEIIHPDDWK